MKLKKPSYKRNYISYDLMLDLTTCLHRLVRCLAWLHNHFCRTARRPFTVRTIPITIKITLGQNVKNARMPKPTGFWFGIASEAKLRGENNDEQRADTNTKKHQAYPQKARHTSVGRSCDFAHIRKLHLTSIRPQKSAIKGR